MGRGQEEKIPFAVGDELEERSFSSGYRGAWFRTRLLKCEFRDNKAFCELEYLDYDGKTVVQLYQHPEGVPAYSGWREMMLRPKFPAVKMIRKWEAGDEAEYLWRNAHWHGKIVKIVSDETAKFKCQKPPYGEGGEYDVMIQELRPALNWTLDDGWQIPKSSPARLVSDGDGDGDGDDEDCLAALREWNACFHQARRRCSWNEKNKSCGQT